ncbi:MAG: Crp/Fnr family transcriptional regulator [Saprospiraceae bacterium]|nr:Crp/Fnr family transcriptional regulator [Saprospiraceae bacterium]
MQIETDLLITWGAVAKKYNKNEFIFYEGEPARFYYQVLEGKVRMCNYNDEGKEFAQGVFIAGDGFGEPPLFVHERYPACAVADSNCTVIKLSKESLMKILDEYPDIVKKMVFAFAKRIFDKATTARHVISQNPEHRIKAFLDRYKIDNGFKNDKTMIPFTRQEIANFTGLRVETVIRTTKKCVI